MKRETQAQRLAQMVQNQTNYPAYELALPPVKVRKSKLKKLRIDDVLLTGFDALEFVLIEGKKVCAKTALGYVGNIPKIEIVQLCKDIIGNPENKKYKILQCSFGTVKSKVLEVEHTIDIAHMGLEEITLRSEGETVAKGILVNVDEEIAIQIKKVIR